MCGIVYGTASTTRYVTIQAPYLNRAIVAAFLSGGVGYHQLSKMYEVIGMPPFQLKTHQTIITIVPDLFGCQGHVMVYVHDADGCRNIAISFDAPGKSEGTHP